MTKDQKTIPGACLQDTNLPDGLRKYSSKIKKGVTQWSQITAWTWCDYLAFAGEEKEEEEKNLKALLIKSLQNQAQGSDTYLSYGDSTSYANAQIWADALLNLLIGNTKDVPGGEKIDLTLSDVMEKITGEPLITSIGENADFTESFFVKVIDNAYSGYLEDAPEDHREGKRKYINYIAYPPRPALSEFTVTEDQLKDWASCNTTDPNSPYLPPSVYIPTAFS